MFHIYYQPLFWLAVTGAILVAIILVPWLWRLGMRPRRLAAEAERLGLHYCRKRIHLTDDWGRMFHELVGTGEPLPEANLPDWLGELDRFRILRKGATRQLKNVIIGSWEDMDVVCCDFHWAYTASGKGGFDREQTVMVAHMEGVDLPHFDMRPRKLWHRLVAIVKDYESAIPDDPAFSARFLFLGAAPAAAVFTPALRRFLLDHAYLTIEGDGSVLLCYQPARRLPPDQLEDRLRLLCRFFSLSTSAAISTQSRKD